MNILKNDLFKLSFLILLASLTACQPGSGTGLQNAEPSPKMITGVVKVGGEVTGENQPARTPSSCPDLDSQLYQLIQVPDPVNKAKELQLTLKEDKVQVLLVLHGEDTAFLKDYGVEVGKQAGSNVQAFVPIARLCELANTEQVAAIRLPARAVP